MKYLTNIFELLFVFLGACVAMGVLFGVYIGIFIVSATVRAYGKAKRLAERFRLANFQARD